MTSKRFTLHASRSTLFWLALAIASLFVILRVSHDYLNTVTSLQNFRWRVAAFEPPATNASQTSLLLEVQNLSAVTLDFKDLEVFLWLNDTTVGKTYGHFETRTVQANTVVRVPLTVEIFSLQLHDASTQANGPNAWWLSGEYKVSAPFAQNDFVYRLRLDITP